MENNKEKKVLFCAGNNDTRAKEALDALKEVGCSTQILLSGENAPLGSVLFFTPTMEETRKQKINFGKWLKRAVHRLNDNIIPEGAKNIPFVVAIRPNSHQELFEDPIVLQRFKMAVWTAAFEYEDWISKNGNSKECPWGPASYTTIHTEEFDLWKCKAIKAMQNIGEIETTPGLHSAIYGKKKKKGDKRYRRHRISSLLINFKDGLS